MVCGSVNTHTHLHTFASVYTGFAPGTIMPSAHQSIGRFLSNELLTTEHTEIAKMLLTTMLTDKTQYTLEQNNASIVIKTE